MLADRAGIVLESPSAADRRRLGGRRRPTCSRSMPGPKRCFAEAWERLERGPWRILTRPGSDGGERRAVPAGLCPGGARAGCSAEARRQGFHARTCWSRPAWSPGPEESPGAVRERFRGRLIFPIHDERGRTIGFGGRILPEVERAMAASGETCRKIPEQPRDARCSRNARCSTPPTSPGPPPAKRAGWRWSRATPT